MTRRYDLHVFMRICRAAYAFTKSLTRGKSMYAVKKLQKRFVAGCARSLAPRPPLINHAATALSARCALLPSRTLRS